MSRVLGITVLPEFIQNEGVDAVLDRLVAAGATAVATSPYVMEPADEASGGREPPDDAGAGAVRLLDRPLWGRRELYVRTAPAFVPETSLYRGLRYQPPPPAELTRTQGPLVREFLRAAQARHLKTYLQVQAAIPPGYRVQFGGPVEDDRPRLPDGRIPPRRLANNGSLASPHIRAYTAALTRDLLRAYPEIDGLRFDWPEYPPYLLDDVFLDFSEHVRNEANRLGMDFAALREGAAALYGYLHGQLTDEALQRWSQPDGGRFDLLRILLERPALADWLRLKSRLCERLLGELRATITAAAGERVELMPGAFPPPWSLASGFDFAQAARHCSAVGVKLYTMHWPMIVNFYGRALKDANARLSERTLLRALTSVCDIVDQPPAAERLDDFRYPEPDRSHPVGLQSQERKIAQARRAAGPMPIIALAHGYGPEDDFRRRLEAAQRASGGLVWINRYGYLSDKKLAIVGDVCR